MKTLLTARFAILLTCSTLFSAHSSAQSPAVPIQDFFKSYFEENLKDEPENATGIGRHDYDDRWSDLSKAGRDAHLAHEGRRVLLGQIRHLGEPGAAGHQHEPGEARIVEEQRRA